MANTKEVKVDENKSQMKSKLVSWLMIVVLAITAGAAIYFWQEAKEASQQTPEGIAIRNEEDSERIIGKVNQILLTNSDSEPTIARIENPQVLIDANPDFYVDSTAGDYLVLYPQRAIIYRESENKIINIAPIINTDQIQQDAQNAQGSSSDSETQN